jgi:hypothetical protein
MQLAQTDVASEAIKTTTAAAVNRRTPSILLAEVRDVKSGVRRPRHPELRRDRTRLSAEPLCIAM